MTKYRKNSRLKSLNFNERNIASCSVSKNNVSKILKRARELNLVWSLYKTMPNDNLGNLIFPQRKVSYQQTYARLCLHSQGIIMERREEETIVERILRGLPHGR